MCPFIAMHNCICQLPQFQFIFPSSGVNRRGNISTANWQGLNTCQHHTHVVENRLVPGKLFMQTDLWYTKLKLLNGDIMIPEWECPTVLAESNTPPTPQTLIIRMYPPTHNAGVWDVTSPSNWPRLWFRLLLLDYKFKVLVMTYMYIDIHSVSGVTSFITVDEQIQ